MNSSRQQQLQYTRQRMGEHFTQNQLLGRTHTIGCVAVEITQKCNLDCTLCYLSEHSQAVKDIPIQEVFRRLDEVLAHYGSGTSVQITGGDPTLRKHRELIEIVEYAANLGLYPALFTNGISATRELLTKLAGVGLKDVAFHVDTTQERKGFANEHDLNAIRSEYIERCKGLGLMVIFNTTLHTGNFQDLPDMIKFFTDNSSQVSFASFQLQAETGRGEWGARDDCIDPVSTKRSIERALNKALPWDKVRIGHHRCHSYMPTLVVNGTIYSVVDDEDLFARFIDDFADVSATRQDGMQEIVVSYAKALLRRPVWIPLLLKASLKKLYEMKWDLIKAKGKVHKLSFFIQNFMDANALEDDRVAACSFMVMTAKGPVSMCEHNAHRDEYILQPLHFVNAAGETQKYEPIKVSSNTLEPLEIPLLRDDSVLKSACGGCSR